MRCNILLCCLTCLVITSCATPPRLEDAAGAPGAKPTQIKGARGMLSARQTEAVLARLRQRGNSTLLDRHLAFEEALLDQPLVAGNQLTLLQDGPATYTAMFAAIGKARDHINLETYIFEADEVGERFTDLLLKKQAEGVQVNIIYDSVGSMNTPRAFFERMRAAGIRVLEFNPINPLKVRDKWLINNRDHRKLLVVDGETAFLGGINISSVYSRGSQPFNHEKHDEKGVPWRDTHVQISGPVVADMQRSFMASWEQQRGETLPTRRYYPALSPKGGEVVRPLANKADDNDNEMYLALLSAITYAEKQIHLTNAYFVPDPQLLDALTAAAARGVDVQLILPGTTDSWAALAAGRAHYRRLLQAGVKLYERRGALLHAKTAIIDGVWSTVGSSNLDWRSVLHNDELNAEVLGPDFAKQMQQMFDYDASQSTLIDLATWNKRPLSERAKEWSAQIWSYWL